MFFFNDLFQFNFYFENLTIYSKLEEAIKAIMFFFLDKMPNTLSCELSYETTLNLDLVRWKFKKKKTWILLGYFILQSLNTKMCCTNVEMGSVTTFCATILLLAKVILWPFFILHFQKQTKLKQKTTLLSN